MGNEGELQDPSGEIGPAMRRAVQALDTSRPITANMNKPSSSSLTGSLDVQGLRIPIVVMVPLERYHSEERKTFANRRKIRHKAGTDRQHIARPLQLGIPSVN